MALMKMKRNLLGIISFQEKSKAKSILQYKSYIQDSKRRDKYNQGVVDRVLAEALIKHSQRIDTFQELSHESNSQGRRTSRRRQLLSKHETNTTKDGRQRNVRNSSQMIPGDQSGTIPRIKVYRSSLFVYEKRQDEDDEVESTNQVHTFIHA